MNKLKSGMKTLIRADGEFAGIVGTPTNVKVDGTTVCIGDIVHVAEDSGHNECEGIVAIFTNRVGVMGLGSTPISKLKIIKIVKSHKDIDVGYELENGYYTVREFEI